MSRMSVSKARDFFKDKSVGFVLSGGGTRGFAHLGALRFLEEIDCSPTCAVGSSVGALVAVCLAAGKSSGEMYEHFLKHNVLTSSFKLSFHGVLDMEKIVDAVLSFANVSSFSDLSFPVKINAMDINTGKEVVFSSGPLAPALQATISLPLLASPTKHNDSFLVDGSMLDVVPLHLLPAVDIPLILDISVDALPITSSSSQFSIIHNAILFSQRRGFEILKEYTPDPYVYIRFPLKGYSLVEYKKKRFKEMADLAYKKCKKDIYSFISEKK